MSFNTDAVQFHLNSSEMYTCLGEIYKMNCTSTEPFNSCNISHPSWYKNGEPFSCFDKSDCTMRPKEDHIEELSVNVSHDAKEHVYYCAAYQSPFAKCQHQSNNFIVPPLRKLECTILSIITLYTIAGKVLHDQSSHA